MENLFHICFRNRPNEIYTKMPPPNWSHLFSSCPDIGDSILQNLDIESSLACRLVCQDWRQLVNKFKPLWQKLRIHDSDCPDPDSCTKPRPRPKSCKTASWTRKWKLWNRCKKKRLEVKWTVFLEAVRDGHVLTTSLLLERGVQVWSRTEFYSVNFSQSRISAKKCVFNISVVPEAMHEARG